MALLNYTTEVPADKSVSEIIGLLSRKGAQRINQEYAEGGKVIALGFTLTVGQWPVFFALPSRTDATLKVLKKNKPYTYRTQGGIEAYEMRMAAQAERVAWRILKDWVEAQLALIETGQAEMAQVFMPYAQAENGVTMWDRWLESKQPQLTAGSTEV
jgi:hypothetical protein